MVFVDQFPQPPTALAAVEAVEPELETMGRPRRPFRVHQQFGAPPPPKEREAPRRAKSPPRKPVVVDDTELPAAVAIAKHREFAEKRRKSPPMVRPRVMLAPRTYDFEMMRGRLGLVEDFLPPNRSASPSPYGKPLQPLQPLHSHADAAVGVGDGVGGQGGGDSGGGGGGGVGAGGGGGVGAGGGGGGSLSARPSRPCATRPSTRQAVVKGNVKGGLSSGLSVRPSTSSSSSPSSAAAPPTRATAAAA